MPGDRQVEAGTGTVRTSRELKAALVVEGRRSDSPYGLVRLRVRLANRTPVPATPSPSPTATATRAQALPFALVSAHALLQLTGGRFLSLEDPPSWAADDADRCEQVGWWPCLAGPAGSEDVVLAAPIIVADHPEIAPDDRRGRHALDVLDRCRIRWGRVTGLDGDTVVVRSQALQWDGWQLQLGEPTLQRAVRSIDGLGMAGDLRPGDWVALHWDWVCDRLSRRQLVTLRRFTARHLEIVNSTRDREGIAAAVERG